MMSSNRYETLIMMLNLKKADGSRWVKGGWALRKFWSWVKERGALWVGSLLDVVGFLQGFHQGSACTQRTHYTTNRLCDAQSQSANKWETDLTRSTIRGLPAADKLGSNVNSAAGKQSQTSQGMTDQSCLIFVFLHLRILALAGHALLAWLPPPSAEPWTSTSGVPSHAKPSLPVRPSFSWSSYLTTAFDQSLSCLDLFLAPP